MLLFALGFDWLRALLRRWVWLLLLLLPRGVARC